MNGKLYFSASRQQIGTELWVSDGTTEGTQLVADINPSVMENYYAYYGVYGNSSDPTNLAKLNGKLYFSANDGVNGDELWVSDGTAEGTQLLVDINPGGNNGVPNLNGNFTELNGKLYFSADDGENGTELWATDGTTGGTQLVANINPNRDSFPTNFAEFDGKLYFSAQDGENGFELWSSDGTAEGTQLFADINPGGRSDPGDFTELNGKLYFSADDGINGRELWVTDGTAEGTQLAADIVSGEGGSSPTDLTVLNDELYFSADDGEIGRELYKLTIDDPVEPTEPNLIEGTSGDDTIEGTEGADRIKGFNGNDVIFALGGNDTVFGDNFSDNLDGGDGDDDVLGGLGNDTLSGGNGNDLLVGKEGNDFFVITQGEGTDTIADFDFDSDRLLLAGGLSFEDLSFNENSILVESETLANLEGIDTTQLQPDNFV